MADRPILFSAPMVRALLDGRKQQTRRVLKDAPTEPGWICYTAAGKRLWIGPNGYPSMPCVIRFAKGDRLWVRESWAKPFANTNTGSKAAMAGYIYRADGPEYLSLSAAKHQWGKEAPWRVSIHMPREASRLTLTVTDVRVQRLTDIDEIDAMAEGIIRYDATETEDAEFSAVEGGDIYGTAVGAYEELWNRINGAMAWAANPWVAAVTFTVERRNIDT